MSYILISAPVYQRAWILPTWFEYIANQTWPLEDIGFQFETAPNDKDTNDCLFEFQEQHPELRCFDIQVNDKIAHQSHPPAGRFWNPQKYQNMILMRNSLLGRARARQPDRFFSLDTDIILDDPNTIKALYDLTETLPVVSPILYMTSDNLFYPSVMTWHEGSDRAYRRQDYPIGTLFQSDVVMAAKMMRPEVYNKLHYKMHQQGEDLGFCQEAAKSGIKLYCASYLHCSHLMFPEMLTKFLALGHDPRLMSEGSS